MSQLVRFKTGDHKNTKARIYECASIKKTCSVCNEVHRDIVLVRMLWPKKQDLGICHYCMVKLVLEIPIELDDKGTVFGRYNPKELAAKLTKRRRPPRKPGPKKSQSKAQKKASRKKAVKKKLAEIKEAETVTEEPLIENLIPSTEPVISEETTNGSIEQVQGTGTDEPSQATE